MRTSPFSLKLAKAEDAQNIVDFLMPRFLEEWKDNDSDWPMPEREPVSEEIEFMCKNSGLIMYENNGVLVGVLGLKFARPFWWSTKEDLQGIVFCVDKKFRSFNSFNRLLSVAEEFAKLNQVSLEMCFFGTDLYRKVNSLIRRGYKPVSWSVYRNEKRIEKINDNQ